MADYALHSEVRRDLLTGLGTLTIGGVAAALPGRAGAASAAGADPRAGSGRVAAPSIFLRRYPKLPRVNISPYSGVDPPTEASGISMSGALWYQRRILLRWHNHYVLAGYPAWNCNARSPGDVDHVG
jgi:hypothetical protein